MSLTVPKGLYDLFGRFATITDEEVMSIKKFFAPLVNKTAEEIYLGIDNGSFWFGHSAYRCTILDKNKNKIEAYVVFPDLQVEPYFHRLKEGTTSGQLHVIHTG